MPGRRRSSWPIISREVQIGAVLAALAERPPRMQLLEGAAGAGKSALAATIAERWRTGRVVTVTAFAERAAWPLGAFDDMRHELGIAEDGFGVTAAVGAIGRFLERQVLVVDDAPRLDEASAEVVRRLVHGFGIPIVATARTGETLPRALRRLDEEGLVHRHHLEGLSVTEVARLLEERFRVPALDEDVHRLIWETEGNPLHLRVLVESAIEAGEVLHRGEAVQIERSDARAGLVDILTTRLADLSDGARWLLGVVALTQPVERARIVMQADRDAALDEVLRRGMIVAEPETGRLRIAHPLIAEVLDDAGWPAGALDESLRLLRASGDLSRRFAAVELEHRLGRAPAAEELVWAAAHASARGDNRVAAELADAAVRQPSRRSAAFAAHLAAASYHSLMQDLEESDRLFALAETLAQEPGERAALSSGLGEHLAFRRDDPASAVVQGERARAGLTAQESVALDADLWRWRALADREAGTDASDIAIRSAIAAAVAASMRGEPTAARAAAEPLTIPRAVLGALAPTAAIALGLQRTVELRAVGTAQEVADYLESARAEAGDEVGFFTVMLAALRTQEGRLAEAIGLAELAVEQLSRWDGGELLPLALALRATVSAQRGAATLAREQLAELDGLTVSGAAVLQRAEALAFLRAADGDLEGAADATLAVVADAVASGYRFLGALALAGGIRFGAVERTAELAEQLCASMAERAEPCVAVRDLALALRERRPERAAPAARRLARAGLVPAAVDGLAIALAQPGNEETRRRLHSLATTLTTQIDAPLFQYREVPLLTPRELEVAQAAAHRLRTREIAERFGVSVRTVDNQLHSAYKKLGIASRDELRDALAAVGLLPDDAP